MITKGGQHFAGAEGGAGARGARRVADTNRFVLRERSSSPRDIIPFMLGGARLEVEDGPSEERADDGLLEWSDDAGVDRGVHEPILDGVEVVGKDVIIPRDAHIARDGGWRLLRLSGG